jgi:hypothetical protein
MVLADVLGPGETLSMAILIAANSTRGLVRLASDRRVVIGLVGTVRDPTMNNVPKSGLKQK